MRIAYDHQIFAMHEYGGISRYFARLASGMAAQPETIVRVVAPLYLTAYLDELAPGIAPGRRLAATRLNRRIARLADNFSARPLQARFAPDIVHETYYAPRRTAPAGARVVLTVYDMIHEKFASMFPATDRVASDKAAAVARADHILCISENTRADLIAIHPAAAGKSSVTLLGFDPSPPVAVKSRPSPPRPYLLFVGQRGGYKNFAGLLEAYAMSPALRGGFDLVAAGGGAFSESELAAIRAHGLAEKVRQVGVDDAALHRCYAEAAMFVYPSLYEGFGIPPLEAMAAGVPVVAMNVSSVPEVCGGAAAYAAPDDPESLRLAIESVALSASESARLVAAGKARLTHFSWSRCVEETAAVYRTLL